MDIHWTYIIIYSGHDSNAVHSGGQKTLHRREVTGDACWAVLEILVTYQLVTIQHTDI